MSDTQQSKKNITPFQWLQSRVAEAHWRWKVWKQLFMVDPVRPEEATEWLNLMSSTAPVFFATLQGMLLEDVVLSICKLVDPAESPTKLGPRRNLSLNAILLDETAKAGPTKSENAKRLIGDLVAASAPLIKWRKWKIAHDDYLVATGVESLPPLTRIDVERAMASAVEIMTLLDATSDTSEYVYDGMIAFGDGDSIKDALRMAAQYRKECLARGVRPLSEAAKDKAADW